MSEPLQDAWVLPGVDQPEGGLLVTGVNKLAQRVIVELMTERGSLQYQPLRGTGFPSSLRSKQNYTETDVLAAFAAARLALLRNLRTDAGDNLAEYPKSIRASRLLILDGGMLLTLNVVAESGETADVTTSLRVET